MRRMTALELAYTAGLFDGEGHVDVGHFGGRQGLRYYPRMAITNTNDDVMAWLSQFGGRVYTHAQGPGALGTKPIHTWRLNRVADIAYLLRAMLPYLIIKRAAVEDLLAKIPRPQPRTGRFHLIEREMVSAYETGEQVAVICTRFGIHNTSLYDLLDRYGVVRRLPRD